MSAAARQTGFTLLEIMVVVMLIGLLTAVIATQGNWTLSEDGLEEESSRLRDTLELLNEESLFSGHLLALRLRSDGWTPLVYDRDEKAFIAIDNTSLKGRSLGAELTLEWQVDVLEDDEIALSAVAENLVKEDVMATPEGLSQDDEDDETSRGTTETKKQKEDEDLPQVFFFPSGEVTPVTLALLSNSELEEYQRWQISALGQVTDPDADPEEEDDDPFEEEQ